MRRYTIRRLFWAGPLATVAATAADVLYYLVTKASGETYLLPLDSTGAQTASMPLGLPVTTALLAGLLATLFFGVLIRYARKPVTVFLSVAITALLLSFGGSFGIPAAALQTKLLLSGMNVLTAGLICAGMLFLGRDPNPRQPIP